MSETLGKKKRKVKQGRKANPHNTGTQPRETKIGAMMVARGLNQIDLINMIKAKTGNKIEPYRMSKIVNGLTTDYMLSTAKMIADALEVTIDEIIELK